jgi:hypothetical protein
MFIIKDARPLYHFAEFIQPLSSIEKQWMELKENENEQKRQELLLLQQLEVDKRRVEGGESVDEDDDEEEDNEDNESYNKDGGQSIEESLNKS